MSEQLSPEWQAMMKTMLAEALADAKKEAAPAARCGLTIRQLFDEYWLLEGKHLDASEACWSRSKHVLKHFGDLDCLEVSAKRVALYREKRKGDKTLRGKAPRPATRNLEVALLRRMLNWACEPEQRDLKVPYNPIAKVRMEDEDNIRETKIKHEVDLQQLIRGVRPVMKALILMLIDTGMRREECLSLRWSQIDLETGAFKLRPADTKDADHRWLYLSPRALTALKALPRLGEYVFSTHWKGRVKRYSGRHLYKLFERAVEKSGLKGENGESITLHTLRHSFVYRARAIYKLPESTIMGMTGHSTRSAFERYGITDDEEIRDAFSQYRKGVEKQIVDEQRKPPQRAMGEDGKANDDQEAG